MVRDAVRASNRDVGGRTLELSEFEFMVRGPGYIKSTADIEDIVLKTDQGVPLRLNDVARVEVGPDERRGIPGSMAKARLRAASSCRGSGPMP